MPELRESQYGPPQPAHRESKRCLGHVWGPELLVHMTCVGACHGSWPHKFIHRSGERVGSTESSVCATCLFGRIDNLGFSSAIRTSCVVGGSGPSCTCSTLSSEAQVERLSMIPSKSEARHLPETGHELRSQLACVARIFAWESEAR